MDESGDKYEYYDIYLSSLLGPNEYIDYKNQRVAYIDKNNNIITTKEMLSLPRIYTYEDYTKIEIVGGDESPQKIEVVYTGWEDIQ